MMTPGLSEQWWDLKLTSEKAAPQGENRLSEQWWDLKMDLKKLKKGVAAS